MHPRRSPVPVRSALAMIALLVPFAQARAQATSPGEQLQRFSAAAGVPASATRGQKFFVSRHGGEWSCASCHGERPAMPGRHARTDKTLEPLAPAANARAFTDQGRVDKWFRRNCRDVLSRECTDAEKADVLAWLMAVRP